MRNIIFILLFFCGASFSDTVKLELEFIKSPARAGLLYVVSDSASGKKTILDQKEKVFISNLVVSDSAGEILFKNSDTMDHNIYANDSKQGIQFDVGLLSPGQEIGKTIDWKADTVIRVGCKIHPKMRAYIANVNSATHLILDFQKKVLTYSFELENVSPSDSEFSLIFPGYDITKISLKKGENSSIKITKKGKEKANAKLSRY